MIKVIIILNREALQLSRQLSELIIEGKLSYMLGKTYLLMGECRLAVEHFNRHKEIAIKVDDKLVLLVILNYEVSIINK